MFHTWKNFINQFTKAAQNFSSFSGLGAARRLRGPRMIDSKLFKQNSFESETFNTPYLATHELLHKKYLTILSIFLGDVKKYQENHIIKLHWSAFYNI